MDRDIIETRGVLSLQRLLEVANRSSGQCRYVARFLLGIYNGARFPFDLSDLRAIDDALFEDCMAVLRMDARVTRQALHLYVTDGERRLEQLADSWDVEDVAKVREGAKRAAQPEGAPAPLHDGGLYQATLHTYGESPGYRDVSIYVKVGENQNTQVELRLSPTDSDTVMMHIARVHALAWRDPERGPLDKKAGERRPAWLDRAPAQW